MTRRYFDFVVRDLNGNIVLVGEVKTEATPSAFEQLRQYLTLAKSPFGMLIDRQQIQVFRSNDSLEQVAAFDTADVLRPYEPAFDQKQIYETYLRTLAEAWLRDLAYRWKSEEPPAIQEIEAIGLLERLAGGSTEDEVGVEVDSVP